MESRNKTLAVSSVSRIRSRADVFSIAQNVRFTSPSPPALASSTGTNNIDDCDVDPQSAHPSPTRLPLRAHHGTSAGSNLRSADNNLLIIPRTITKIAPGAFRVSAPTIWNSRPLSLRCTTTTSSFRSQLKTYFFLQRVRVIIDFRKTDGPSDSLFARQFD